jgi:dihydrofolate reductase
MKAVIHMTSNRIGSTMLNEIPAIVTAESLDLVRNMIKEADGIVVGRKTFETMDKFFAHKDTYVMTRGKKRIPGAKYLGRNNIIACAKEIKNLLVVGGISTFCSLLPMLNEIVVIEAVNYDAVGTPFCQFPGFKETSRSEVKSGVSLFNGNKVDYVVVTYTK